MTIVTGTTGAVVNFNGTTPSIVITGNGKLVVNAGSSIVSFSNDAITSDGDVEINGGTVFADSGNAIRTTIGSVVVNDGTISSNSGNAIISSGTTGAGDIIVNGGMVSSSTGSAIVTTNANVTVRGGNVASFGASSNPTINAGGNVTVSGGGLVESINDITGGVAIESTGHVQIDGGGVFADIDTGTAIIAQTSAVANGVVSALITGVTPYDITAGLVIDGTANTGKVYGNTSVKVTTEIPAGTTVSFEQGSILNVEANTTVTIAGELDTTGGTANISGILNGTGYVTGSGSLVKKTGGFIDQGLNIHQNVNQVDESTTNPSDPIDKPTTPTNPDNPVNEESVSGGCDTGTLSIVILTLPAIFSMVSTARKRVFKRK